MSLLQSTFHFFIVFSENDFLIIFFLSYLSYQQRCSLEAHMTRVHNVVHKFAFRERRPKLFVCEDCGVTFPDNNKFRQHEKESGCRPNKSSQIKNLFIQSFDEDQKIEDGWCYADISKITESCTHDVIILKESKKERDFDVKRISTPTSYYKYFFFTFFSFVLLLFKCCIVSCVIFPLSCEFVYRIVSYRVLNESKEKGKKVLSLYYMLCYMLNPL